MAPILKVSVSAFADRYSAYLKVLPVILTKNGDPVGVIFPADMIAKLMAFSHAAGVTTSSGDKPVQDVGAEVPPVTPVIESSCQHGYIKGKCKFGCV